MNVSPDRELLITGAKDFLKASGAIATFGGEIWDIGVSVLKNYAPQLRTAAGIPLDPGKIQAYPKDGYVNSEHDGQNAQLGPCWPLTGGNFFNLYVWWRISEKHVGNEVCSAVASVGCRNLTVADTLERAVRTASRNRSRLDDYEVYFEQPLSAEDFIHLESRYGMVVEKWIGVCKKIGGLKKYLK
jgi:hypothetical protein